MTINKENVDIEKNDIKATTERLAAYSKAIKQITENKDNDPKTKTQN